MLWLKYALVPHRPSDAPIYRKGRRPRLHAKPTAGVGGAAVLAARQRLYGDVRPWTPAATPQEPDVRMDVDPTPWAHNFETPAWNIDFPDAARHHPEISADTSKARFSWGTSPVVDSTPICPRKGKTHEESGKSAAHPKAEEARTNLSASPAKSSPISSRKAEKSRARDAVPSTSSRKAEKARIRDDPAESVNITPSASSRTAEESLHAFVGRSIMTANMVSSSKVKSEDMSLPAASAKVAAAINISAPALIADVQVNNTSTSLNQPENIKPPREPLIVTSSTVRQLDNSNDVTDVIMFEDDYTSDHSGYVPEFSMMELDWVGP